MILQEFSFGNFRSFKEINTLNLAAANIKSKNEYIEKSNIIEDDNIEKISFLKSKAIYGANGSGKSNLIKAFITFYGIVRDSVKDEAVLKMVDSFKLSTETEKEPTFFQIVFWSENVKYRYGFEVNQEQIIAEWLYGKKGAREQCYFIREGMEIIELDKTNFNEGVILKTLLGTNNENEIFRTNSLLLTSLSTFGIGKLSKDIINNVTSIYIITGLGDMRLLHYASSSLSDSAMKNYILTLLKYGDIGIEDLSEIEIPVDFQNRETGNLENEFDKDEKAKVLLSTRKKYNKDEQFAELQKFPFAYHESEGTQKLFGLSPFIYKALKEGRTIIIDEFDARFHPLLTQKILELFNSEKNVKAQIVFVTHDTNLLSADLMRRDQIEFVEKDRFGASHSYSLIQFKGIRNNASFEKDYIQGRYGAIPFLGNLDKILEYTEEN